MVRGSIMGRQLVGSLVGRGIDHQLEALLGRWELGNIVVWVSSTDVLLH